MSNETGATDAQIERATLDYFECEHMSEVDSFSRYAGREWAKHLVPPDHRIVSVEDLEILFSAASYDDVTDLPFTAEWTAMLGRIRALIGGAAEGIPEER